MFSINAFTCTFYEENLCIVIINWTYFFLGVYCYPECGFMRRFIYKLQQFFYGRNGTDGLNLFLMIISVVLLTVSMFIDNYIADSILSTSALLLIVLQLLRSFSRNLYKRRRENAVFMSVIYRIKGFFSLRKRKWKERKTHRYKKCPACKAQLRFPKNKGKIQVTCPKCGKKFTTKV